MTYALGVLAQIQPAIALEAGVVVAALLAFSVQLHRFVRDRITEVSNIADAITFLASDRAAFMTGSEEVVDGRFTAN